MTDIKTLVGDILEKSEFLTDVAKVNAPKGKSVLFGDAVRALTSEEIKALEAQRNSCADWKKLLVAKDFCSKSIWDTYFAGVCVLGVFKKADNSLGGGVTIPAGIYRSIVVNSEIGNDVTVHNCAEVCNYVIQDGAVIASVAHLSAAEGTASPSR